jgi:hypothetical protein
MDPVATVTKPVSTLFSFIKAHMALMLVFVAGLFVLAMAKKDTIIGWFTSSASAPRGDRLPAFLRKWFGLAILALASASALLYSGDAVAAVCSAAPAAAHDGAGALGWLAAHWHYLAGAGASLAFGLTQFSAPDVIDCVETHGGASLDVTAPLTATTTVKTLYARTSTHAVTSSGAPLVATDITVEVATKVKNLSTGTHAIEDDDLARILSYLQIESPIMGSLTDQISCTGPVLDLVTRFIGDAFERSGDAPVASITVESGDNEVSVTKYFTKPLALRFLDKPLSTAPWLGLLDESALNIGLAADTCLGTVSTGATVSGDRRLKASISYLPVPHWFYPLVPYDRVDNPASGSNGIEFKNFGGPGPRCTAPIDMVHTIGQLSNLKGLPGNMTFDTLTKLLAPRFGLDSVENIPHLVKARIRAQYYGHIGGVDYAGSGNYAAGTPNAPGMALASLLFFLLQQPSLDMDPNNMRKMGSQDKLPMQYTTSGSRTGADAFYFGALRQVSPSFVSEFRRLPASKMPSAVGKLRHFATGVEV